MKKNTLLSLSLFSAITPFYLLLGPGHSHRHSRCIRRLFVVLLAAPYAAIFV